MSAGQSAYYTPLMPQEVPICAVSSPFCLSKTVQLRIFEKLFSGDEFHVSDPVSGTVYFRCQGRVFSDKKVLLDNTGTGLEILNLKKSASILQDKFKVYAGNNSDKLICTIRVEPNFLKPKLKIIFNDVISGQHRFVVLKGDAGGRKAVFYLGEPKEGGIPIGKVLRKFKLIGANEYTVEIASGVDITLLVTACIVFEVANH